MFRIRIRMTTGRRSLILLFLGISALIVTFLVVTSPFPAFAMSTASNNHNKQLHNNANDNLNPNKSTNELKTQWAGGRDIWPAVPLLDKDQTFSSTPSNLNTVHIETRVRSQTEPPSYDKWPTVVNESILYGFGAYNPRGQTATDEYNDAHHQLLLQDIVTSVDVDSGTSDASSSSSCKLWKDFPTQGIHWWEASSIWQDGTSERGFIVAFRTTLLTPSQQLLGKKWVVDLAAKYGQGAVYEFRFVTDEDVNGYDGDDDGSGVASQPHLRGRLIRETVPVLDPGTDALVEVVVDKMTMNG